LGVYGRGKKTSLVKVGLGDHGAASFGGSKASPEKATTSSRTAAKERGKSFTDKKKVTRSREEEGDRRTRSKKSERERRSGTRRLIKCE